MPKLDITPSYLRSGFYAVVLRAEKERIQFHFGTRLQALKAILKVEKLKTTEEIKNALIKLCGGDYFSPLEESERTWESWRQSSGIHSSSSSSDQSKSSLSG